MEVSHSERRPAVVSGALAVVFEQPSIRRRVGPLVLSQRVDDCSAVVLAAAAAAAASLGTHARNQADSLQRGSQRLQARSRKTIILLAAGTLLKSHQSIIPTVSIESSKSRSRFRERRPMLTFPLTIISTRSPTHMKA